MYLSTIYLLLNPIKDLDLIPACPSFVSACIIYCTRVSFDAQYEGQTLRGGEVWGERLRALTGHCPEEKEVRKVRLKNVS